MAQRDGVIGCDAEGRRSWEAWVSGSNGMDSGVRDGFVVTEFGERTFAAADGEAVVGFSAGGQYGQFSEVCLGRHLY
jgi:hypothetical protein